MTKISKRLQKIASFVRSDAKVIDIGCDHALLDIYLVHHWPTIKAIAVDVRPGALKQARRNTEKYKTGNAITLRFSDGLTAVNEDEMDTIVISGMGCASIIDILTKNQNKLHNVDDLIIQSNKDHFMLRKSICDLGYYIMHEALAKDRGIIYLIIHFTKGQQHYSHDDYMFGPLLRCEKDKLYREWVALGIKRKEILYSLIPQKYDLQKEQVGEDISKLKSEIK